MAAAPAFGDVAISTQGPAAGQTQEATGLGTDEADSNLFVADRGNRRVDVFNSATGSFIRAFGWGVVASGPGNKPRNEVEEVDVDATGGTFNLLFVQNSFANVGKFETVSIPFDATAAAVDTALESLPGFAPGDVSVTGPDGGPWIIEFTGAYADTDVHELEEGSGSDLSGGAASLEIATVQPGANYEVCEAADGDVCRAGQRGVISGQLNPISVAADPATGDVYVFDGLETGSTNEDPNNRVQKFTAEGEFLYMLGAGVNLDTGEDICTAASGDECGRGQKGSGPGEFDRERSSVAVGPSGVLYVSDGGRVQKFSSAGTSLGEVVLPEVEARQLAVDSAGNIYGVINQSEVRKYDPSGTLLDSVAAVSTTAIAITMDDALYVTDKRSGQSGISRYDSSLNLQRVYYSLGSGLISAPPSAIAPAPGGAFVVEKGVVNSVPEPAPGPVVYPAQGGTFAAPIGNVRATLTGEVNAEGKASTYHFQYVEQSAFEAEGWSSTAVKESPESSPVGSDLNLHQAQAVVGCANPSTEASKCLTPSTKYRFRLVATNADGTNVGPDATFTTKPPFEFGALWSTDVDTESATLHGEGNPVGFQASGYFELVTEAQFQASGFSGATKVPAGSDLDFGSGEASLERSAEATGLEPATAYRYRLVVTDNCKPTEPSVVCTSESDPVAFTTMAPPEPITGCSNDGFRTGPAALLADCRAYEMVSPVDKGGTNLEVGFNITGYLANFEQSASDGQSITYSAYKAFSDPESSPFASQYMGRRTASGWTSESISPPREGPMIVIADGLDFQFKGFTSDLCFGWVRQDTAKPLLDDGAISNYENLYRRDNCSPEEGQYKTITTATEQPTIDPREFRLKLEGFSADGSKAVFSAPDKLTANAKKGKTQAYESINGELKLVCILPTGKVSSSGCFLGSGNSSTERERSLFNAVSDDGSHVFWSADERIYLRINGEKTVAVSESVANEPAFFWGASGDGSRAIFSIGGDLYEFDVEGETSKLLANGVEGVAGMSQDATEVYFVSDEALTTGAEVGNTNLYVQEGGSTDFIADIGPLQLISPVARASFRRSAQVTPDGDQIIFMASGQPTGYDNLDVGSSEPDQEVFLYDSTSSGGAGALNCISCNPTGARPEGRIIKLNGLPGFAVAGTIPTFTTQLYQPRVITDDGSRAFFNSYDRLVAADTNGKADVYQWERAGAGSCSVSSSTYVGSAAGCISLVSSGQNSEDSTYVDTSANGADVFFKTYSSLVSQDPGLLDIYDARVDGGFAPPPEEKEECQEESCQPQVPSPPGMSPNSAVSSPGNPKATKPKGPRRCPKGKHKVKRKGKIVCAKNKKKHHQRHRGAGK